MAWAALAHAQYPSTSSRNTFGGYNYSNGGYSASNIFGGSNYYQPGGGTITSQPNIFGGMNYSNGWSSRPNIDMSPLSWPVSEMETGRLNPCGEA
jgi:hypothetical protein